MQVLKYAILDARAAAEIAPRVAEIMAGELGRGDDWIARETADFQALAMAHLPE